MAYTLSSLQGELGSLLLKRGLPPQAAEPAAAADTAEPPRWRLLLRDLWAELRSLVQVRRQEGSAPPLLTPGEQVFLTQHLHLKLETARLALLDRDNRNFHASLASVQTWLHEYYDAGSAPVEAMSARIREMEQANIAPPLPDISASLHALQTALERRRGSGHQDDGA
jgi:uroporphyrin-3 C-methyltransferase